jgi:hypothetical protein
MFSELTKISLGLHHEESKVTKKYKKMLGETKIHFRTRMADNRKLSFGNITSRKALNYCNEIWIINCEVVPQIRGSTNAST